MLGPQAPEGVAPPGEAAARGDDNDELEEADGVARMMGDAAGDVL